MRKTLSLFGPMYTMEFLRTFGIGMMTIATTNYLFLEVGLSAPITGLVTGIYLAGFPLFALLFGTLSDQAKSHQIIQLLSFVSFFCAIFSMIPVTNTIRLVFFTLWRFGEAACNGIFWPIAQKYSLIAASYGVDTKRRYLSGYNLAWNTGALSSMIVGALVVYGTGSNYLVFYGNLIANGFEVLIAILCLKSMVSNTPPHASETNSPQNEPRANKISFLTEISMIGLILVLSVHSLTDGALSIIIPIKMNLLGYSSVWTFLIAFSKSIFQTIFTSKMSHTRENWILKLLYTCLLIIPIIWTIFLLIKEIWVVFLLAISSGIAQGTLYALGMILMTYKAQKSNSARPYSYFQAITSGGRMMGPWIIGLGALITTFGGMWILIGYDLGVLGFFLYKTRYVNNKVINN